MALPMKVLMSRWLMLAQKIGRACHETTPALPTRLVEEATPVTPVPPPLPPMTGWSVVVLEGVAEGERASRGAVALRRRDDEDCCVC